MEEVDPPKPKKLKGQCRHGFAASVCTYCKKGGPDSGCRSKLCIACYNPTCTDRSLIKTEQKRIATLNKSPHYWYEYDDDCKGKYNENCIICPYRICLNRNLKARIYGEDDLETCSKYEFCTDGCPHKNICSETKYR